MISVIEKDYHGETARFLYVDGGVESAVYLNSARRNELILSYMKKIAEIIAFLPEPGQVLMIGGAGFSMPRFLLDAYPAMRLTVVEKDVHMLHIAKESFFLPDDERLKIAEAEGSAFLKQTDVTYDLIINDAFLGPRPDPALLTDEAVVLMKSHLTTDGTLLLNTVMSLRGKGAFPGIRLRTNLENRFLYVRCSRCQEWKMEEEDQNCILTCSDRSLPIHF